ncbi:MAG TPA: glycoside hydrolase family 2 protein [Bacillota bacterium]
MYQFDLNGAWKMKRTLDSDWSDVTVPGSVFHDLLNAGKIEDPFYRANEEKALEIAEHDYEYQREFTPDPQILQCERVFLSCEGLDTLAGIDINGFPLAKTDNMHRSYEWEIKSLLHPGTNIIHITFLSPLPYIRQKQDEHPTWGAGDAVTGFQHLTVTVKIDPPQGPVLTQSITGLEPQKNLRFDIDQPDLWWPNGYGEHPLYRVEVLLTQDNTLLDRNEFRIGLRRLTIKQEKDEWGESFQFEVNGLSIFTMGADYIPEDNLLPRCNPERTERLIRDCVDAHFNCLRVWGGGLYPPDYFYDLCDRYGLIVWQDFMYACASYVLTEEFAANVRQEAIDNIRRIRHHPCLGLWCGNNEMEEGWASWNFTKTPRLQTDYIKQFEILLPDLVNQYDPNTFYWPSSPSSGGGFENPNSEKIGDVHYWDVWHGLKPFTDYRNHYFRFVSEFGFQAFPGPKTVAVFTIPEDRNIFSYVMERHQKNASANGKILYYLSQNLKYPKDFEALLYASQVLQAEAIQCGVEHWRRNRGRCMGAIYWQLNDCWPVASWASIDYFGRWKALHYFAKRFFAPVLLSACETDTQVGLYLSNDRATPFIGEILWRLRKSDSRIIREGRIPAQAAPLTAALCQELQFNGEPGFERRDTYLEYSLIEAGQTLSLGSVLFAPEKHFEFLDPRIEYTLNELEDRYIVSLTSRAFARCVALDLAKADCQFSDNYFDLSGSEVKEVAILKESLSAALSLAELKGELCIRSLYDIV